MRTFVKVIAYTVIGAAIGKFVGPMIVVYMLSGH
jgi:hypothetical protein